jgi:hypothetical protein
LKLRFFCDLCGTEVPRNTVRCPTCGRYFTAIQCPRCHFQGEEQDFAAGCPSCGYMRVPTGLTPRGRARGQAGRAPRRSSQGTLAPVSPRLLRLTGVLLAVALLGLLVALFLI